MIRRTYGQSEASDTIFGHVPVPNHSGRASTLRRVGALVRMASLMKHYRRSVIEPFGIIRPENISEPCAREPLYQGFVKIVPGPNSSSLADDQLVVVSTLD